MELYDDMQLFEELVTNLENIYKVRSESLRTEDRKNKMKINLKNNDSKESAISEPVSVRSKA